MSYEIKTELSFSTLNCIMDHSSANFAAKIQIQDNHTHCTMCQQKTIQNKIYGYGRVFN